jgi:hypothetical protein
VTWVVWAGYGRHNHVKHVQPLSSIVQHQARLVDTSLRAPHRDIRVSYWLCHMQRHPCQQHVLTTWHQVIQHQSTILDGSWSTQEISLTKWGRQDFTHMTAECHRNRWLLNQLQVSQVWWLVKHINQFNIAQSIKNNDAGYFNNWKACERQFSNTSKVQWTLAHSWHRSADSVDTTVKMGTRYNPHTIK